MVVVPDWEFLLCWSHTKMVKNWLNSWKKVTREQKTRFRSSQNLKCLDQITALNTTSGTPATTTSFSTSYKTSKKLTKSLAIKCWWVPTSYTGSAWIAVTSSFALTASLVEDIALQTTETTWVARKLSWKTCAKNAYTKTLMVKISDSCSLSMWLQFMMSASKTSMNSALNMHMRT